MKITITVKNKDLRHTLEELKGQMGFYFQDKNERGLVMMGEKMNVYLDNYPYALMPDSTRTLHILAKPFVL